MSRYSASDVQLKFINQFNAASYSGRQVVRYSTRILFNFGWMNPIGSVFSKGMLVRTLVMCGITVFAAEFRCGSKSDKWSFCFPVLASTEGLIFASLVSFLLGLFTSTTFSRWWSIREKLSLVMNNIGICTMYITHCIKSDEDHIQNNRLKLVRLFNLLHALMYKQVNGERDLSDLVEANLIFQEEEQVLKDSPNMCATVSSWQFNIMETLSPKISPPPALLNLVNGISIIFSASQDIFTAVETQQPYAYLHLLTAITKIHILFVVFYAAGIVSQGIDEKLWTRIMLGFAIVIFNNIIYEGLLYIHDMLVNPLGHDRGDFPYHLYKHTTESLTSHVQLRPVPITPAEKMPIIESAKLSVHADIEIGSSSEMSPPHKHRE